ncbi:MAG: penicillin-binding protein 2 [Acidimicrobiales bacterium]
MNRQIRRLGIGMLALFLALFAQLNIVHVFRAESYNDNPNNTRAVTRDFNRPRGQIVAADGTVLARSEAVEGGQFNRQRVYPEGELFGHITGYFSFSFGFSGVEQSYNAELAGRTAPRIQDLAEHLLERDPTADVTITIPTEVQRVARDGLGEQRGSVVALDPRDGSILALWSFPSYDPTALSAADQDASRAAREQLLAAPENPLLPRAYRETFFPGSTFKVVTAAAGLASGAINPQEPDYPRLAEFVPPQTNQPIRNFGGATCGGVLIDILRVSCNTAFAQLGVEMGAEPLVTTASALGFNDRPPIDLPAPVASTISPPEFFDDNIPVLAQTAIGQNAVRATPLQMAMVAGAIANGGTVMAPHVMAEVVNDDGEVIDRYRPSVWRTAMTPEVAATVTEAMVAVVADGTAGGLAVPGVTTAGKTGTAQIGNDLSHAWIIGFAPAEAPRVAVAVIVEAREGASEQTGGRVAAPIARAVLAAALEARPS